ncbi:MAG TPA: hypothetical protein VHX42_00060 [Candidatus Babeliales bacterium]|jgi:hypothetical protein|nr:hypothetical protein [Candidatus Babeliales bacterium]
MQKYIVSLIIFCGTYNNHAMELSLETKKQLENSYFSKAKEYYVEKTTERFSALLLSTLHPMELSIFTEVFSAELNNNTNVTFYITNLRDQKDLKDFFKNKSDEQHIQTGYSYIPTHGKEAHLGYDIPKKNAVQLAAFLSTKSKNMRVAGFEQLLHDYSEKFTYTNATEDALTIIELYQEIEKIICDERLTNIENID